MSGGAHTRVRKRAHFLGSVRLCGGFCFLRDIGAAGVLDTDANGIFI